MSLDFQKDLWDNLTNKEFSLEPSFDFIIGSLNKGDKVLDYGCGYGRYVHKFYDLGFEAYGYDYSNAMIQKAKLESNENCKYFDKINELYAFAPFSFISLIGVLTCIPDNCDQAEVIAIIKKLSTENTILLIADFLVNEDDRNKKRYDTVDVRNKYPYGTFYNEQSHLYLRHHYKDWILELMQDFEIVSYMELNVKTMNGNDSRGFELISKYK